MEESCELVKMAVKEGIHAVVATPHYSRKRETNGYRELAETLKAQVQKEYPEFQIYVGHELIYHDELAECLENERAFTMAGSRYVLVEFEPEISFQMMIQALRKVQNSAYIPILAHVERYACLKDPAKFQYVRECGCLFQMNYDSLVGFRFQKHVRWCRKYVKAGYIHFLGTDMHRVDNRPPKVCNAMKWLETHVDERLVNDMTYCNALRMINNERIS